MISHFRGLFKSRVQRVFLYQRMGNRNPPFRWRWRAPKTMRSTRRPK